MDSGSWLKPWVLIVGGAAASALGLVSLWLAFESGLQSPAGRVTEQGRRISPGRTLLLAVAALSFLIAGLTCFGLTRS